MSTLTLCCRNCEFDYSEQKEYLTDSEKATKEEAVTGLNGSGTGAAVTDRLVEINEV